MEGSGVYIWAVGWWNFINFIYWEIFWWSSKWSFMFLIGKLSANCLHLSERWNVSDTRSISISSSASSRPTLTGCWAMLCRWVLWHTVTHCDTLWHTVTHWYDLAGSQSLVLIPRQGYTWQPLPYLHPLVKTSLLTPSARHSNIAKNNLLVSWQKYLTMSMWKYFQAKDSSKLTNPRVPLFYCGNISKIPTTYKGVECCKQLTIDGNNKNISRHRHFQYCLVFCAYSLEQRYF